MNQTTTNPTNPTNHRMDNFLRILDHGGVLSVQEMRDLHTEIRELQMGLKYWKDIAEDRKRILNMVLEVKL